MRPSVAQCSTEKTLLHTLRYDQYRAALTSAGLCGMAELTTTSKAELHKMGLLPGHANLLLQCARKPSDAWPAPKHPKSTRAPAPKLAPKLAGFFVGRSVLYTSGNGATVGTKVVKNHGNAIMIFNSKRRLIMVRLSMPRAKLQIA